MEKNKLYLWVFGLALIWPLAQVMIFYVRFGQMNSLAGVLDYVVFYIAGLLSVAVFFKWLLRSAAGWGRNFVIAGFVLSSPFSWRGALVGGMLGSVGVILFSLIPVVIGAGLGYWLGKRFAPAEA